MSYSFHKSKQYISMPRSAIKKMLLVIFFVLLAVLGYKLAAVMPEVEQVKQEVTLRYEKS